MRRKLQNARLYKTALSPGLPQGSPRLDGALGPRALPPPAPLGETLFQRLKIYKHDSAQQWLKKGSVIWTATKSEQPNMPLPPPPPPPIQNRWCPHFKNWSAGPGFSRFPDSVSLKRKNEALACRTPLINAVSLVKLPVGNNNIPILNGGGLHLNNNTAFQGGPLK